MFSQGRHRGDPNTAAKRLLFSRSYQLAAMSLGWLQPHWFIPDAGGAAPIAVFT
jgi:hypothetical protein